MVVGALNVLETTFHAVHGITPDATDFLSLVIDLSKSD
jgi:hypothetical protein